MSRYHFVTVAKIWVICAGLLKLAMAADCNLNQVRGAGDPSGQQIATALTKNNQLNFVCSGEFPPGNNLIATFNHGFMNYNVTRGSPNSALEDCQEAFQNIIDQCITGGSYWGGTFNFNDKIYAIYNQNYPSNGLNFGDDGGPPLPGSDSTSSTTRRSGQSTSSVPVSVPGETVVTETNSQGSVIIGTVSPPSLTAGSSKTLIVCTNDFDCIHELDCSYDDNNDYHR